MIDESLFLAAEINELEALLATLPADHLIQRMSLEARLVSVKQELETLPRQRAQRVKPR